MAGESKPSNARRGQGAAIEWTAGAVGLLLTLALLGFIAWRAFTHDPNEPPHLELRVERVVHIGEGYVAQIVAHNRSQQTAQGVEVEGTLSTDGSEPEKSAATFNYIPGGSSVRGGLHFSSDPRAGDLKLRALGHIRP